MKKLFSRVLIILFLIITLFTISGCRKKVKFNVNFYVENQIYEVVGTNGKEVIEMPTNPTKDGYTFEGWYWDEGTWLKPFTAQSLVQTPLKEDMNVYAYFLDEDAPRGTDLKFKDGVLVEHDGIGDTYLVFVSNSTIAFSFTDYVDISNKSTWTVSTDMSGNNTIASKTVELEVGNNLYFIQVFDSETNKVKQYNVAVRRRPIYTVYFNTNGGTKCLMQRVEEDSLVTEPTTSKTGYTFTGWDYNFDTPLKSDIVISASWSPNQYTITFDANGGSLSSNKLTVTYDKTYTLPTPYKEGHTFSGWYENNSRVTDGIWGKNSNITLVAKWSPNTYSINYNLNGGTISSNKPSSYTYGNTKSIPNPTKTGYEFIGWTVNNSSQKYKDYQISNTTYGNLELVANYKPNVYTITLDSNGGICDKNTMSVEYNSIYSLPTPTKVGYTFDGWYNGSSKVENGTWKKTTNLNLKAKWSLQTYSITYNLNGGINNNNPTTYNYESDDIKLSNPTKEGYTFIGWTGEGYNNPTVDIIIPKNSVNNRSYVANWEAKTYTITYDVNGGNGLDILKYQYTFGNSYTLPVPTKDYYNFVGWYYNGKLVESGKWAIANDCTLTAKWSITNYNIYYNLDGGVNNPLNPNKYMYESDDIILQSPTKEGYTFIGWTSDKDTIPTINLTLQHNSSEDITYTAHWKANSYTITYDVNGGDELVDDKLNVNFDSSYELTSPTRTGYTFIGWYYNNKLVSLNGTWSIANNCTLTAKWKANTYTITIITSTGSKSYTATYDSSYTLTTQSKSGYTFDGYFLEQYGQGERITDANGKSMAPYTYTENITVYAAFVYEVNFVTNGGEEVESVTYYENEYLDSSITATKEGKTFAGWYIDEKLTSKVSYTSSLGNKTLYARWQEEVLPSELIYTISNGSITISGSTYIGENLIIPSHIGGVPVTTINSSSFANMTNIVVVEIPDSVESIGASAFKGCNALEKITIPFVGLTETSTRKDAVFGAIFGYELKYQYYIGKCHTHYTSEQYKQSFEFINIKYGQNTEFSTWQFTDKSVEQVCDTGSYLSGPYNIGGYAGTSYYYYIPSNLKQVVVTQQSNIPLAAFNGCYMLESIIISKQVDSIGECAFQNCSGLKRLNSETDGEFNIPTQVKTIADYTFYGCSQAVEFTMGELESIGSYAFYNCSLVEYFNTDTQYKIDVPDTVTSIKSYAFNKMVLITEIYVPDSVDRIENNAFSNCNSLSKITIPFIGNSIYSTYTLETIGVSNDSLKEVVVTSDNTIPASAFSGWTNLEKITIPSTVYSIGNNAFSNCSGLKRLNSETDGEFNIPTKVKTIADYTFYGCSQAVKFTMGEIESIGSYAFCNCSLVEYFNSTTQYKIEVPSTVTSIGSYAFNGMVLITEIYVPDSVDSIENNAFSNCYSLSKITIPFIGNNIESTSSLETIGVSKDFLKEVTITSDNTIPASAFSGWTNLEKITIASTVYSIGNNAFSNCSGLKRLNSETDGEFNIPTKVKTIADYTFYGCSQAVKFTMGEIESIGSYAFCNCSLVEYFNSKTQYKIDVPNTVTSIGSYAFYKMVLITEVNVPDSVESIGASAFKGCNAIEKITIPFVGLTETSTRKDAVFGAIFGYELKYQYYIGECHAYYTSEQYNQSFEFINIKYGQNTEFSTWQFTDKSVKQVCGTGSYLSGPYNIGGYAGTSYYYFIPSNLKQVVVTQQSNIPLAAFNGCYMLESIIIPKTVESIGKYAFQNCSATIEKTYNPKVSSIWSGNVANSYHSGTGTKDDPYVIFTASEFAYFASQVNNGNSYDNTYFKLSSNIRLANREFNIIGSLENPFNGYFDGCGHIIRDFSINGTGVYTGLFGYVNGTIENVGIENVTINATSTSGGMYYAGIIAYLSETGVVKNVYSTGNITNNVAYYAYVGGIVGYSKGLIENSYSTCSVNAKSTSLITYAGGLVGYLDGTIKYSFSSGNVTANGANDTYSKNGGIVGDRSNSSNIVDCYRSDTQVLTRYSVSNKSYNEDGAVDTIDNIMESLKQFWIINWKFNKKLPKLIISE